VYTLESPSSKALIRCIKFLFDTSDYFIDHATGIDYMKKKRVVSILCVLLLLSIASAGCVVNLQSPSGRANSAQSPSGEKIPLGTDSGTAHMLAVWERNDSNYAGALSDVIVSTEPGTGHVFVETRPLTGVDFQETARTAVNVAAERAHINPNQRDFKFIVRVPAKVDAVDGPSAGLPMAVAVYSAMIKKQTNSSVYGTGAINSDGTVSNVGGVYWKALAAARSGARTIIVPSTETAVSTTSPLDTSAKRGANLHNELERNGYDTRVIGVKNIDEALPYYFS